MKPYYRDLQLLLAIKTRSGMHFMAHPHHRVEAAFRRMGVWHKHQDRYL